MLAEEWCFPATLAASLTQTNERNDQKEPLVAQVEELDAPGCAHWGVCDKIVSELEKNYISHSRLE